MRNTAPRRVRPVQGRYPYSYTRGSAAPAYPEYDPRPQRPQQQRKKRLRPVPVPAEHYTRYHENIDPALFTAFLVAFIVMACSIGLLSINSKISAVKAEKAEVEYITNKTKNINTRLETMLSETVDMDEVKKIASTRLGMQTAAPHQIVEIEVDKDSYSIQYEDQVAEEKNRSFLEKLGIK